MSERPNNTTQRNAATRRPSSKPTKYRHHLRPASASATSLREIAEALIEAARQLERQSWEVPPENRRPHRRADGPEVG